MSEPIIVLNARKRMTMEELDKHQQRLVEQMKDGLIVVPCEFSVVIANPNQLKCAIKVEDIDD